MWGYFAEVPLTFLASMPILVENIRSGTSGEVWPNCSRSMVRKIGLPARNPEASKSGLAHALSLLCAMNDLRPQHRLVALTA